jgi:hypothetical protein
LSRNTLQIGSGMGISMEVFLPYRVGRAMPE